MLDKIRQKLGFNLSTIQWKRDKRIAKRYLAEAITSGDFVGIIGGGFGETALYSRRLTPWVSVYEGSKTQFNECYKVFDNAGFYDIDLHHTVVGEPKCIWGNKGNPDFIKPEDLPPFDILEIDVEGSELSILKNLEIEPKYIISEIHLDRDIFPHKIKEIMQNKYPYWKGEFTEDYNYTMMFRRSDIELD